MNMRRVAPVLLLPLLLGTCASAATLAHWTRLVHVRRPVDLVGPRPDGSLVLAAGGGLRLLSGSGRVSAFAPGYRSHGGEPYIALPAAGHPGCSFGNDVYALRLRSPHGVLAIDPAGRTRRFAQIAARGLENGIAFDETGRFAHHLLVTVGRGTRTTVDAIDCHGVVTTITRNAPRVEGGIAVAPASFGRFGGDLIAPDELSGRIYAISSTGHSELVATSDLPHGQDIGVESEAFIPKRKRFEAVLADRLTPGNRHPGDDVILRLSSATLSAAGVRPGDLLVASEGGAQTDALHCVPAGGCQVTHVADGPAIAHAEGHIAVVGG